MKRMITRLIIAQLIPVAIKVGKKAFSKKRPAAAPNANLGNVTDAPIIDVVDKTNG